MDEERQETADWRIVWQMFFPCVISDLIGGCVENPAGGSCVQRCV